MVILVILSLLYYTTWVDRKIDRLNSNIAQVKNEIVLYKDKADEVTKIKKKLKNLELKLGIVRSLEAKQRESVLLIDGLTRLMVPERMWLTSLKTDAKSVVLKGLAFDNKTVADFMTRVEESSLFSGVDLKTLQMKQIKGDARIKSFEVFCWKKMERKSSVDMK
jgi:type IV pilus assembly protein PilN